MVGILLDNDLSGMWKLYSISKIISAPQDLLFHKSPLRGTKLGRSGVILPRDQRNDRPRSFRIMPDQVVRNQAR
jgi:hypothetical protein